MKFATPLAVGASLARVMAITVALTVLAPTASSAQQFVFVRDSIQGLVACYQLALDDVQHAIDAYPELTGEDVNYREMACSGQVQLPSTMVQGILVAQDRVRALLWWHAALTGDDQRLDVIEASRLLAADADLRWSVSLTDRSLSEIHSIEDCAAISPIASPSSHPKQHKSDGFGLLMPDRRGTYPTVRRASTAEPNAGGRDTRVVTNDSYVSRGLDEYYASRFALYRPDLSGGAQALI